MNYTKILVVDDDSNIRDLLKQSLENEGYEVRTAADGYEAIDTFKKYEPDIMLLDIMLPGKSGRDVCTEIRKFSSKPIIMITAKGDVVDKVVCLELGADDFIVKPFDMNELFARIKAVLRRCNSHEEPGDNRVFTRDQLLDKVWGFDYLGDSRTVDVHVKRLREKLDGVSDKWTLKTVWGVGYKFEVIGN